MTTSAAHRMAEVSWLKRLDDLLASLPVFEHDHVRAELRNSFLSPGSPFRDADQSLIGTARLLALHLLTGDQRTEALARLDRHVEAVLGSLGLDDE